MSVSVWSRVTSAGARDLSDFQSQSGKCPYRHCVATCLTSLYSPLLAATIITFGQKTLFHHFGYG